ncbi:stress-induced protein KIN2-like [Benincasa hispida]|uniref:stress-induced protein KIN2-like n=1 Tax=Benincasa hispida TaxID=102211 RepID=UPI0019011F49|nr:stress-induced protein KIN2-like [Benincasa hispida]
MTDNSQKMNYHIGEAKGQAQIHYIEKANNMMDKASHAAQSAKESMQEAGQQIKAKAQSVADTVKDATGINK